jgi:hypothetical protein
MLRRFTSIVMSLAVLAAIALPGSVLAAYNPLGNIDCSQAPDSAVCKSTGGDPIAGSDGILPKITNIVAVIAGVMAVIFLIVSGMKYVGSQGDAQEVSKAKQSIIYALIGIVVIAIARYIINFVLIRV